MYGLPAPVFILAANTSFLIIVIVKNTPFPQCLDAPPGPVTQGKPPNIAVFFNTGLKVRARQGFCGPLIRQDAKDYASARRLTGGAGSGQPAARRA